MRILIAAPHDEEVGGVSYVVGNLAKYFKSRGHDIVFVFPGRAFRAKQRVTRLGFRGFEIRMQVAFGVRHPVISIPAYVVRFPVGLYQLLRLIRKYRIQIINVHYPMGCFYYLALCSRLLSIPLVTSIHGADVFPKGKKSISHPRELNFIFSSSKLIVTPSNAFKKHFLSFCPALRSKTRFIHNGVDLFEIFELSRLVVPIESASVSYVLCVSAYKEQKAIDTLIRAYHRVNAVHPSVKLVLVGAGELRQQLETLAASLGLQQRIEFVGPQARQAIIRLLLGCRVFVLPSRFETFGIAILEAMACAKPVVATNVGGIPEIIDHGATGLLVRPDDPEGLAEAIVKILSEPDLAAKLARNALVTAQKKFKFENTGEAYEAVYESLLKSAATRAIQSAQISR
jgi:glycosyltransferase involved in cell wall biosynthesis